MDNAITHTAALAAWKIGNNAGEGYAVGIAADHNTVDELGAYLGELIYPAQNTSDVAVYRHADGRLVAVGDSHGPWAVDVTPAPITDADIEALSTAAAEHGDIDQVAECDRALDGDLDARRHCAEVIDDARAQADD